MPAAEDRFHVSRCSDHARVAQLSSGFTTRRTFDGRRMYGHFCRSRCKAEPVSRYLSGISYGEAGSRIHIPQDFTKAGLIVSLHQPSLIPPFRAGIRKDFGSPLLASLKLRMEQLVVSCW